MLCVNEVETLAVCIDKAKTFLEWGNSLSENVAIPAFHIQTINIGDRQRGSCNGNIVGILPIDQKKKCYYLEVKV